MSACRLSDGCCTMSNLPGAITKRPNDHMVNASFGNPAVETTTFHIAQQDHFVETRINRDGTINRILVPDRADRWTSDDPRLPRLGRSCIHRTVPKRSIAVPFFMHESPLLERIEANVLKAAISTQFVSFPLPEGEAFAKAPASPRRRAASGPSP